MKQFEMVNICNTYKVYKYERSNEWIKSEIIPYYRERYACYALRKEYDFNELITLYLERNGAVQVGAISVIAEKFALELYGFICKKGKDIPRRKIKFLYEYVVPDYLPIILPRCILLQYDFTQTYPNDIWVKIYEKIKTYLALDL